MKKIFLLLILSFPIATMAQDEFKDRFFIGFVSSYYIDFISSPMSIVDLSRTIDDGVGGTIQTPDTAVPFQTRFISFISIGVEPRYNLYQFNENAAIAIAAPMTLGFGQAFEQNEDVEGARGYGNFQLPILLKFYMGTNSTYESTEDFGFSAGAGFEYNKLALIPTDENQRILDANRGWIMPTFSVSVHFWRGNSPIEINFKHGRGALSSYRVNSTGSPLPDGERFTRANSTKLSFIYLLDY